MKLSGGRLIPAAPEAIWAFLLTPERLQECLPGCERFEQTGPGMYSASMRLGVGFLKGSYRGTVRIADERYPESLTLAVEGGGALGSLTATGTVSLTHRGAETDVRYDGEADVQGRVAMVGERVLRATADKIVDLFLGCVASQVRG